MRIAIDANPLLWRKTTGIQNHARGICEALVPLARGEEFVLLYERSLESAPGFDDTFLRSLPAEWRRVAVAVPGPTAASARWLWERWALPRLLKKHRADVYYSMTTRGPAPRACPVAVTVHDLAREACDRKRRVSRPLARLVRRATRVFVVSETTGGHVRRILGVPPHRLVTVYNAPAPGIAPVGPSQQREACEKFGLPRGGFLLCVGDENWRRQYSLLWETMERLWSAGHLGNLVVAFVGRQDWQKTELYARARRGSWPDGAAFLNNVETGALAALYSAARATVVPTEAEGFGMPVVEALACGCPVVCSDIPVLREVADGVVRFFELGSQDSLADAVQAVAGDATLREELSRRGREHAMQYTWQAAAGTVLETLRLIASGRGG